MFIRKIKIDTIYDKNILPKSGYWLIYGHSDMMTTKLLTDDKNQLNVGLQDIYTDYLEETTTFHQIFYLLSDKSDVEFFEKATNIPFCAIYFITFNVKEYQTISVKSILENANDIKDETIFLYDTIDNYGLIAMCYGNDISEIESKMEKLFESWKLPDEIGIKNTYRMYMSSNESIKNYKSDKIKVSVQIQISVKTGGERFSKFKSDLINSFNNIGIDYKEYKTNGSKNWVIYIYNINLNEFFSLYSENSYFSLESEYRNDVYSSTNLKFLSNISDNKFEQIKDISNKNIAEKFEKKINTDIDIDKFYVKQIDRIKYSMLHVLSNNLPIYSFLTLYFPLKKFIDKINNPIVFEAEDTSECIKCFIESAREIINMSDASQISSYPMQPYVCKDILAPSQLISFYSAFLWKYCQLIRKCEQIEIDFTFCLNPSLSDNVQVKGLFLNDGEVNNRLLLVDIPMKYIYEPAIMLFSLCHEASHYVSERVRCRTNRTEYIRGVYQIFLFDNLLKDIDIKLVNKYKLNEKIENIFTNDFNKYANDYKYPDYSMNVEERLSRATKGLLSDLLFDIDDFFETLFNETSSTVVEKSNEWLYLVRRIKKNCKILLLNEEYSEFISTVAEVFSESFADLMAINFMNVDEKFYREVF